MTFYAQNSHIGFSGDPQKILISQYKWNAPQWQKLTEGEDIRSKAVLHKDLPNVTNLYPFSVKKNFYMFGIKWDLAG